jgi:FdrA protein
VATVWPDDGEAEIARRVAALGPEQHALCGVYAGGTLAAEAAALIAPALGGARARQPLPRAHSAAETPAGAVLARWPHRIVDYGDDAYTHGRAHPVIDPRERQEAIRLAGEDPHIAVLLLDVILGCGTHPDPAGALAPALEAALVTARARGGDLVAIAHVCGTDLDPQPYTLQCARLERAGALVARSNAQAARYAARALALLRER